jgi:hypothetical protein
LAVAGRPAGLGKLIALAMDSKKASAFNGNSFLFVSTIKTKVSYFGRVESKIYIINDGMMII